MRTVQKKDSAIVQVLTAIGLLIMIALFGAILATGLGWQPPQVFAPSDAPQAQPTMQVRPAQPPVVQQQPAVPAIVPTANIPAVQQIQFEPAPPADVAPEQVQPHTEIISVQRAPEQTTITRTVPNKPAGPPIVIDKGVKQRGAPRP